MFGDFEPLNDLVLVKRYEEESNKLISLGDLSLVRPDKYHTQSNQGIVVSVSTETVVSLQPGDRITFGIGNAETLVINGEEHLLIRENDIRGVERAK